MRVWDAARGTELLVLRGHEARVYAAAFSPDGARIVSALRRSTQMVRVWDAASGRSCSSCAATRGAIYKQTAFSPDGARIVQRVSKLGEQTTVRVWDAASGTELLALRGHEERQGGGVLARWRTDRERSDDKTVRVWDAVSGAELLVLRGHEAPVYAAAFSPDGARIVSGSADNTVRVWDAASGAELLVLRGDEAEFYAAAFSPDGARIVSGSDDGTVRVWDAASGAELLVLRGQRHRSMRRRSRRMATDRERIW